MKKRNFVWIIALLTAAALFGALWQAQGKAQASGPGEPGWLAFGGQADPAQPVLSVLGANAQAIDVQANLPGAWVETVYTANGSAYTRLSNEGYGFPAKTGLPEVPVLRQDVEIPFGAQVRLELVEATYTDYTLAELGLAPIYPMQPPLEKTAEAEQNQQFIIDQGFYTNGSRYPAAPLALGETYSVRGHRIQTVEIWPVAYDPAAGTLRLYSQVTLRLALSGSDMTTTQAQAERYASPLFEASLSQRVLNYNQGRGAVNFAPNTSVGYLIITADAYYDAMLPFVALRESRGFEVTMTRTSEIPGGATTAAIKAYIQDAYDTWPLAPSYVLLVGDTDTIPGWGSVSAGEVTDLYYATMGGSSDWHPDLGRGRFPVRSPEQTTIMVNKYLAYAALTGEEAWLNDVSFPATCDNYTVAEGSHNYVISEYTALNDYWGTFPANPQAGGDKLYCITYSATRQNLINAFNEGRWAIIYSGHGGHTGWEMDFSSNDVRNLTHYGIFPFVASHACISGDFAVAEVYGETWVLQENKGALVYWGSSDSSYWGEDDVLERAMWDALFVAEPAPKPDVWTMTDAGLAAVETAYPSMARYYYETYNILGDPAVKIFREPEMATFTLDVEPASQEICSAGVVTSTVEIGSIQNYTETVYLLTGALPVNVTAAFDPDQAAAPYTADLRLEVTAGAAAGDYTIPITATDYTAITQDSSVALRVVADIPAVPGLFTPADGATSQALQPQFTWEALPLTSQYAFQLDASPHFDAPLVNVTGLSSSTYSPATPLDGGTCYWWRASGENACGESAWAEPYHFSTVALEVAFSDDIESGGSQWTHEAAQGVDHWAISTAQSHSPTHAWFVPDDAVTTDSRLRLANPVSVGVGSALTFWHRYQFEGTSYDGSVLEISTNGGSTWSDLGAAITSGGYNGTISTCCSNPLGGRDAWTSDLTTWTEVTVDLSAFAGQDILVRWRFGADYSIGDTGWYIDDVQISAPLPASPAPTLTAITPEEGFYHIPTPVQISGSNFFGNPLLLLGSTRLEEVTVISPTLIEATIPAGISPGTYDLVLYNGDCQETTLADAFTFLLVTTPPEIINDEATTDEDVPIAIDVLANDSDPNSLWLSLEAVGAPLHGTASISGTLALYTPALDFYGTDTFTYTAFNGLYANGVVTVTVLSVDDIPVADPQSVSVTEDTPQGILLTGSDAEGSPISFTVTISPMHGILSGAAPDLTYTPLENYNGDDSFAFIVNDGVNNSAAAVVTISVQPVNDAPVAEGQTVNTQEDIPAAVLLIASDVDGDPLIWNISDPSHGVLTGSPPDLTYTPEANWYGTDTFTFTVNDGMAGSNIATVTIIVTSVDDAPLADPQSVSVTEDTPQGITLSGSDAEGSPLSFTVTISPAHGALSGTAPNLTYTPLENYSGDDSFAFIVNDGVNNSAAAVVTISVQPVNDAPVMPQGSLVIEPSEVWANQVFTLTGSLTDADPDDTHTVIITWEMGITETLDLPAGLYAFSIPHTYAERGEYSLSVTVYDAPGEHVTLDLIVNVQQTLYMINLPMVKR